MEGWLLASTIFAFQECNIHTLIPYLPAREEDEVEELLIFALVMEFREAAERQEVDLDTF